MSSLLLFGFKEYLGKINNDYIKNLVCHPVSRPNPHQIWLLNVCIAFLVGVFALLKQQSWRDCPENCTLVVALHLCYDKSYTYTHLYMTQHTPNNQHVNQPLPSQHKWRCPIVMTLLCISCYFVSAWAYHNLTNDAHRVASLQKSYPP